MITVGLGFYIKSYEPVYIYLCTNLSLAQFHIPFSKKIKDNTYSNDASLAPNEKQKNKGRTDEY